MVPGRVKTLVRPAAGEGASRIAFDATGVRRERMRIAASRTAPNPASPVHSVPSCNSKEKRQPDSNRSQRIEEIEANQASSIADLPQEATRKTTEATNAPQDPAIKRKVIQNILDRFCCGTKGYPSEMIELDWDIEADLGIDSIKKSTTVW